MARHRLTVLLIDQVLPLDLAIPMHVFAREAAEAYDVVTASLDGRAVPIAGGTAVIPDGGLELLRGADTVVVPGYAGAANEPTNGAVVRALQAAGRRNSRMISICSGAFALAQAGLLDGLVVTTHWSLCDDLAAQHPELTVDPAVMFVDNGSVMTSGGVTAGVDLCLHVLRKDLGPAAARHVSRRIVMAPRRDGAQQQFIESKPVPPGDDAIARVQQRMLASLAENHTVVEMAARAHMSERTFHRQFRDRTAMSPVSWLLQQRIARAKELLETTELSIEEVARQVGLGSTANLRIHFRRATNLAPREHRRLFSFSDRGRHKENSIPEGTSV
jgi:transcriptional regulator GlxA family with amidase domain